MTCEKSGAIERVLNTKSRARSMRTIIRNVAAYVRDNRSFMIDSSVLSGFFLGRYETKWFPFEWMFAQAVKDDMYCIQRMLRFFQSKKWEIIDSNVEIAITLSSNEVVTHNIPFLMKDNDGKRFALNIFYKMSDKSYRGKSLLTRVDRDLYACAAKLGLEDKYPGITVVNLYLLSDEDSVGKLVPELKETSTKSSNVFFIDFREFYSGESFLSDLLLSTMESVISELTKRDCSKCHQKKLCFLKPANLNEIKEDKERKIVTSFTDRQMQAIKAEGPCLICAGPGSGKTATIVGKVHYMVTERKIDPANILLISFTNEAVHEMQERISLFCENDMPTISTINSLAYRILCENAKLIRSSGRIPVLTENALKGLIKDLLSATTSLDGINLGNPLAGPYGLLNTVMNYFLEWQKMGDDDAFLIHHVNLGQEFLEFAHQLNEIIQLRGFITFDEQLSRCYELLIEHPDILSMYQKIYKYILVDEFQDVDKQQANLIYLLSGNNRELTVVGDDDQAIYGWRGGSNEHMLSFSSRFGTNPIVLDVNFRSSNGIVGATQDLIANSGTNRIRKNVSAFRTDSNAPVLVPSKKTDIIEYVIYLLRKEGFLLKDIAILARTNAELKKLQEQLSVPSVLAKNYLCESSLFILLLSVVSLIEDIEDNQAWFELFTILGQQDMVLSTPYGVTILDYLVKIKRYPHPLEVSGNEEPAADAVLNAFQLIANLRLIVEMDLNAPYAVMRMLYSLGIDDVECAFYNSMADLLELYQIHNIRDLAKLMRELRENGDTYKLPVEDGEDAVKLYTMHESKGCEFPAVILLDNNDSDYADAESIRTLYVGLTRPKDRVFFMSDRFKELKGFEIMNL